jgi:hypothetical protein
VQCNQILLAHSKLRGKDPIPDAITGHGIFEQKEGLRAIQSPGLVPRTFTIDY